MINKILFNILTVIILIPVYIGLVVISIGAIIVCTLGIITLGPILLVCLPMIMWLDKHNKLPKWITMERS